MARAAVVGLLLLAAVATVAASRSTPDWGRSMGLRSSSASNTNALKWFADRVTRGGSKSEEPCYVALKYEVPPSMMDDFVDEWERFEKDLRDEKRCDFYMLSKTMTDNLYFWAYMEWDTCIDMMEHFDTKYVEKFTDFLEDNDILVEMFPLEAVGDTGMETRGRGRRRTSTSGSLSKRSRRDSFEEEDPRELPAHVLIQFHVPPSECEKFEDAWMKTADRTYDEEENRHYALRKFVTMNHHYMACGSWDSIEGYLDHVTSKHFRKLREFTADCDIEWHADTVRALACSEKGDRKE